MPCYNGIEFPVVINQQNKCCMQRSVQFISEVLSFLVNKILVNVCLGNRIRDCSLSRVSALRWNMILDKKRLTHIALRFSCISKHVLWKESAISSGYWWSSVPLKYKDKDDCHRKHNCVIWNHGLQYPEKTTDFDLLKIFTLKYGFVILIYTV